MHSGARRGAGTVDRRDQHGFVTILDRYAEPATLDFARRDQLADHRVDDLTGDREADANRGAGRRNDDRTDPDHLAVHVEYRSAGIDRCVELQKIVEWPRAQVTALGGDDAGGDGAAQTERIARREDPIADLHLPRVAPGDRDQRLGGDDLDHRDIGQLVLADEFGRILMAVGQGDDDFFRVANDVVVGDDAARRVVDEAGARAQRALRTVTEAAPEFAAERGVTQLGRQVAQQVFARHRLSHLYVDHRREHFPHQRRETV